jgi:hypothetical protein
MTGAARVVEIGRRGDYDGLEGLSRNGRGDATSVGETPASTRSSPATARFVADSPLEESGFELAVPSDGAVPKQE